MKILNNKTKTKGLLPPSISSDDVVILFDSECVICSGWAQFVLRWTPDETVRIGSVQSKVGQELLVYAGLTPNGLDTMLLIEKGTPYVRSTALLRVCRYFRFPMSLARIGLVIPTSLRDWLYNRIAGNRYKLFGKKEACLMPPSARRGQFLDS